MKLRRTLIPLFPLVLAACGEEAEISVSADLGPRLTTEMLTVFVIDKTRVTRFTGADFRSEGQSLPTTARVATSASGPDLEVSFTLTYADTHLSGGTVFLPRRSDWRWHVTVSAATTSPEEGCFGCLGSQAFELAQSYRAPGRDSIWLVWGGNSISNPVVY
jgi:hypothetical protein